MKSMKFYIYVSNIAVLIFSMMFVVYGCMHKTYVLTGLGIVLGIYGSLRLYRMLKAFKSQETE